MNCNDYIKARFENISKSYDAKSVAVKELNLDIKQGEFLTLLGASGSGKTTSLMMLAGFEQPTSGQIYLNGGRIDRVPPHKRGMGIVFQNYSLFPHMTVAENVAYPLKTRGVASAEIRGRVGASLEMVRLSGFEGRRPTQLSGGQQQRIALARALIFKPEIVLMDEPLGALDKNLREDMQGEISRLHAELQATIVYVTHDQSEALTMSNRIAVFDRGTVRQLGSPRDIYEDPKSTFVANFVGTNNGLDGSVQAVDGSYCTVRLASGEVIRARCANNEDTISRTTVSLRPERILVEERASVCTNRLSASVREAVYLGDHSRMRVSVPGLADLIVKVDPTVTYEAGMRIELGWMPDDCIALDPILRTATPA